MQLSSLCLLVVALILGVVAQNQPTVDVNTALFNQNGGRITWSGTNFVQDDITQFNLILRVVIACSNPSPCNSVGNAASTYHIAQYETTDAMADNFSAGNDWIGPNSPMNTISSWVGCKPRTYQINAAGTRASCILEYIDDSIFDYGGPGTTISLLLDVANQNGLLTAPVQIASIANVAERIFPGTTADGRVVPNVLHGISVAGTGFPAFDSIVQVDGYQVNNVMGERAPYDGISQHFTLVLDDVQDNVGANEPVVINLGDNNDDTLDVGVGSQFGAPIHFADQHYQFDVVNQGTVNSFLDNGMDPAEYNTGDTLMLADNVVCTYDVNQIDCYYVTMDFSSSPSESHALFATLFINVNYPTVSSLGDASGRTTSGPMGFALNLDVGGIGNPAFPFGTVIGPIQIADIDDDFPAPTLDAPANIINYASRTMTLTGSNFVRFPGTPSNLVVAYALDGTGYDFTNNQFWNEGMYPAGSDVPTPFRCDTTNVNAAGTSLTCQLAPLPYSTANHDIFGTVITGDIWAVDTPPVTDGFTGFVLANYQAISNVGTMFTVDTTEVSIAPRTTGIQQDARTLIISAGNGGFPVTSRVPYFDQCVDVATCAVTDMDPLDNQQITVTLTGLLADETASVDCTLNHPNNVRLEASVSTLPQNLECRISEYSQDQIVIELPEITAPIGQPVFALFNTLGPNNAGNPALSLTIPDTIVGVISPGAGVGGDPHFFGFLGEKYDFAGEVGHTYNLLSDANVQLNAKVGEWRVWKKETVFKSFGLKVNDHQVDIDAGGSTLSSEGFSISMDGEPIPEGTTKYFNGGEGTIQWNSVSSDVHLPLWENHHGVAMVSIILQNYQFQVLAIEEGKDANGVWHQHPTRFLDFMAKVTDASAEPHGLFGQTVRSSNVNSRSAGWSIEGEGADYEVSHIFADDFTFNRFNN